MFALSVVDSEPLFAIYSSQIWLVLISVHSESSSFSCQGMMSVDVVKECRVFFKSQIDIVL